MVDSQSVLAPPTLTYAETVKPSSPGAKVCQGNEAKFAESLAPLQLVHALGNRATGGTLRKGDMRLAQGGYLLDCGSREEANHVVAVLKGLAGPKSCGIMHASDKRGLNCPVQVPFRAADSIREMLSMIELPTLEDFQNDPKTAVQARNTALEDLKSLNIDPEIDELVGVPQLMDALIGVVREGRTL